MSTPEAPLSDAEALAMVQRHLRALQTLAKRRIFISHDFHGALASLTELCSHALEVQRSSVWVLTKGDTELTCLHLHDQAATTQGAGGTLPGAPFPTYFRELLSGKVIAADDAQTDPRTREFTEPYLKPLDIRAMLDAPIRLHDRLVGVVCQEHTESPRHWHAEDVAFAGFVANTASMLLETYLRGGGAIPGFAGTVE